ncbi:hypothetical protein ACLOJK_025043 [Asimina triloba]
MQPQKAHGKISPSLKRPQKVQSSNSPSLMQPQPQQAHSTDSLILVPPQQAHNTNSLVLVEPQQAAQNGNSLRLMQPDEKAQKKSSPHLMQPRQGRNKKSPSLIQPQEAAQDRDAPSPMKPQRGGRNKSSEFLCSQPDDDHHEKAHNRNGSEEIDILDRECVEAGRARWTPCQEQLQILETVFTNGMVNPPRSDIVKIREALEEYGAVSQANVFYWFQNRRSRCRRHQRHRLLQAAQRLAARSSRMGYVIGQLGPQSNSPPPLLPSPPSSFSHYYQMNYAPASTISNYSRDMGGAQGGSNLPLQQLPPASNQIALPSLEQMDYVMESAPSSMSFPVVEPGS